MKISPSKTYSSINLARGNLVTRPSFVLYERCRRSRRRCRSRVMQLRRVQEPQPDPPPNERPKPLHERIDDLIVATHRTKDLSLEDSQAGLLKALALLKEARVIVASRTARMGLDKPKDTESMVSQIWDEIHQLKQAAASSRSNSSPARS